MSAPLQNTYETKHIYITDTDKALIILEPQIMGLRLLGGPDVVQENLMTVEEFWFWFQFRTEVYLNGELGFIHTKVDKLEEETRISFT